MQVTVKLFAYFRDNRFKEEGREYPKNTTVTDVVNELGIVADEIGITMINSRHCDQDAALKEGDILAIFPVVGGG
ncbi:MAG: MoaD/ThiS family protein [Thermodesulfobacteriota bacterium]